MYDRKIVHYIATSV